MTVSHSHTLYDLFGSMLDGIVTIHYYVLLYMLCLIIILKSNGDSYIYYISFIFLCKNIQVRDERMSQPGRWHYTFVFKISFIRL
jgi:hypothetical protein